jgi:predicted Zn-dependent protease
MLASPRVSVTLTRAVRPALVALALAACATNPVTGRSELSLVSESDEIAMGQQAKQEAARSIGLVDDQNLQSYVSSLGMMIGPKSERPHLPWSYQLADDPSVNAFALPGGPTFVTRGLLSYANSEAQLFSVLGHETGHITHKHQVNAISRQQLTSLALGVGMIVRPELQQFGGLASQALGLLFLKFSRQQETEADDLGFKYMVASGYDPREMTEMFRILQRIGEASGAKTPGWLATHPDPGDRAAKTEQRIAAANVPTSGLKVNRDAYLQRIDGLVFGEDPRNGYFRNTTFLHPVLRFRLDFPGGWKTQNAADQVAGISSAQDAVLVLSGSGTTAPSQALTAFLSQQGLTGQRSATSTINGLPAAVGSFTAQTQQGPLAGWVAFASLDGTTYQILGYTLADRINQYDAVLRQSIGSFQRLTDPASLSVKPQRIRIVRLPRAMSFAEFSQSYPSVIPAAQVAAINGVTTSTTFPGGALVKRVVVE